MNKKRLLHTATGSVSALALAAAMGPASAVDLTAVDGAVKVTIGGYAKLDAIYNVNEDLGAAFVANDDVPEIGPGDSGYHGTWKASSWYQDDRVDELLRTARAETDRDKRAAAYEEASRIVVGDAADIWIYNTVQLRGLSDKVKGYKFSPVGSGGEIRWMSLAE